MKSLLIFLFLQSTPPAILAAENVQFTLSIQQNVIHPKDLPQKVRKYITDHYGGAQITKAMTTEVGTDSTKYIVHIKYKQKPVVLKFDRNGSFIGS